jgi:hypothetical protein
VVILTNADDAHLGALCDKALALAAPVIEARRAAQPRPPADPAWARYVGTYVSTEGRDSGIAIVNGRLAWYDPAAGEPAKSAIYLDPAGPDRFRFAAGLLVGEIAVFETDPGGAVLGMRAGGNFDRKK